MITEEQKKDIIRFNLLPNDYRLVFRVIAMFVSWYFNKSVMWGLIHFFFGWVYLSYMLFTGQLSNGGFGEVIQYYFN